MPGHYPTFPGVSITYPYSWYLKIMLKQRLFREIFLTNISK